LPTTRNGRGPPNNELHLCHAVAMHHSLNQCVYFLQRGLWGFPFPTKVPHFGLQGLDFSGLTAPQHHRLLSLTLRLAACHNNAASLANANSLVLNDALTQTRSDHRFSPLGRLLRDEFSEKVEQSA
jgi:hypothetical protein